MEQSKTKYREEEGTANGQERNYNGTKQEDGTGVELSKTSNGTRVGLKLKWDDKGTGEKQKLNCN